MSKNPLLSWDDWDESENPAIRAAAAAVKQIDTSEVLSEVAKQEQVLLEQKQNATNPVGIGSFNYTPDLKIPADREIVIQPRAPHLNIPSASILERAVLAISNMDGQLPHGGRLKSEDKKLLNSATDLNQLVPFKYDWAWAGYLESCNAHWMPTEISLEKDLAELEEKHVVKGKEVGVVPTNDLKILNNMLVNHNYMKRAVPNMAWLNLYRLLENPEGRQYLLRQTFEETLTDHAISNIQETLGLMSRKVDGFSLTMHLHLLEDTYKERHQLLRKFLPTLTGDMGTTVGIENVRQFILEVALIYGFADWIAYVAPIYQVMKLNAKTKKFNGVAQNAEKMLRDLVHHQQIFKLILDTAVTENPEAVDDILRTDFVGQMKKLMGTQEDILTLLVVDGDDYAEITWLMKAKMVEIQTALGIHSGGNMPVPTPFMQGFTALLEKQKINLHGGGSSVLAQSGGALAW